MTRMAAGLLLWTLMFSFVALLIAWDKIALPQMDFITNSGPQLLWIWCAFVIIVTAVVALPSFQGHRWVLTVYFSIIILATYLFMVVFQKIVHNQADITTELVMGFFSFFLPIQIINPLAIFIASLIRKSIKL